MDLRELPGGPFQRHPWEVARMRFFRRVIVRAGGARRVLDAGAGDGYFASELRVALGGEVICFDPGYTDEQLREPGRTRERPAGLFDLILLLDVLEHVADEREFLHSILASLAPGGLVLISVPAWPALYSRHDLFVGHHRRYRPAELRRLIAECGLVAVESGGLFASLLLPRAGQKLAELARGVRAEPTPALFGTGEQTGPGHWRAPPVITAAVTAALEADAALGRLLPFSPPGLSAWALCRRAG
jgi:SAM-dependent methyltransferase